MNECVQERQDEQRGRHLVATLRIPPGSKVVSEKAAAAVLYDSEATRRCHTTFDLAQNSLRCGACKHARYANKHNQRAAWSAGHREECAALKGCHPQLPPPTVRLVARVLWRQRRYTGDACNVTPAQKRVSVSCLQAASIEPGGPRQHRTSLSQTRTSLGCFARGQESLVCSDGCSDQVERLLIRLDSLAGMCFHNSSSGKASAPVR